MSKKTVERFRSPKDFPPSNAKVGDQVLYWDPFTMGSMPSWQRWEKGVVTRVGLRNKHGYCLDIRIRVPKGNAKGFRSLQVGTSDDLHRKYLIYILPPARELSRDFRKFLSDNKLVAVRKPRNGDEYCYGAVCPACHHELYFETRVMDVASFQFEKWPADSLMCLHFQSGRFNPSKAKTSGFRNGDFQSSDGVTTLTCECESKAYASPDGFKVAY